MEFLTATSISIGLVALVVGFLLATVFQSRKATALGAQLDSARQACDKANNECVELQAAIKATEDVLHQKEVAESGLNVELNSKKAEINRLETELSAKKEELNRASSEQKTTREERHHAETELKTAYAEKNSLAEQVSDLKSRLEKAEQNASAERGKVDVLKKELSVESGKYEALNSKIEEYSNNINGLKSDLQAEKQNYIKLDADYKALLKTHTELKTSLDEREASHAREVANFEQQKNSLSEQFKVLSNDILEAKTKSLQESSKLTLDSVMNPFKQTISEFKKEVQDIHHRETTQQGELRKELESLKELNQKITTEAHELSTALRGQKKLQGNWGELVLENVLDRSGLQQGKDYKREVSFTTEEGRQRPDAIVYLPQNRHLIIDAKVSLNAYTRFVNAEDKLEQQQALKEHVQAVRSRIQELADRDYYKLPGLNSPEMVFMFIPIESAFVEALKADETLFQQAIENNVLVATPTTLLTSLNIVRQLWRYEDQNKHTAALADKADAVFKKLSTFLGSFEKIKKGLDSAVDAYSKAEGQLVSGKGNLVKQVGEFKNLAPAIKAELPGYFVDKAALEVDFIATETTETPITEIESH